MSARWSGFTLIELAIVLVIVGLLLGSFLRAHDLISGAQAKNLANDFRVIPAYLYGYQDRFRALPGDDSAVLQHLPGAALASPPASRGNGIIDAAWNATGASAESRLFWQHVRMANLANGAQDPADPLYMPRNVMGGMVGVSSATSSQVQIAGMHGDYQVCSAAIPGRLAKQLDTMMDDGDTARGNMRTVEDGAALNAPAVLTDAVADNGAYTVCMTF